MDEVVLVRARLKRAHKAMSGHVLHEQRAQREGEYAVLDIFLSIPKKVRPEILPRPVRLELPSDSTVTFLPAEHATFGFSRLSAQIFREGDCECITRGSYQMRRVYGGSRVTLGVLTNSTLTMAPSLSGPLWSLIRRDLRRTPPPCTAFRSERRSLLDRGTYQTYYFPCQPSFGSTRVPSAHVLVAHEHSSSAKDLHLRILAPKSLCAFNCRLKGRG